ncbi:MAG: hypothetical protein HJJLKODD_01426 [Phycisphaerae bacterium]|nr:hypothetical protein [Phycisphaerae bacterium]
MYWGALCDEFYISTRLFLKLDLSLNRETVLHFFDQMRKEYPRMSRLRRREDGAIVLEEEGEEQDSRRWVRLEENALRFGYFAPPSLEQAHQQAAFVLEQAPFHLTFSDIDYDHMELVYGFDLEYSGNHDQLIADVLFRDHPLAALLQGDETQHVIDMQPYLGIALTPECDLQAYIEIKSRTATYEVRTGGYDSQPLSVYLTLRKYWGYSSEVSLINSYRQMSEQAEELAINRVVPLVVNPLAQAIASGS